MATIDSVASSVAAHSDLALACFGCGTRLSPKLDDGDVSITNLSNHSRTSSSLPRYTSKLSLPSLSPDDSTSQALDHSTPWTAKPDGPDLSDCDTASVRSSDTSTVSVGTIDKMWPALRQLPSMGVPACEPCISGGHFQGCRPLRSKGFWNPCCPCLFGAIGDGVLRNILSFLSPAEAATSASVCSRFAWASASADIWARGTLVVRSVPAPSAMFTMCNDSVSAHPSLAVAPPLAAAASSASESSSSVSESASSSVVVSKRQALKLSPASLLSLLQQHGPAMRSLEARALDLAAFMPVTEADVAIEAVPCATVATPSPSELRRSLPPSLRSLTMAARLTSIDLTGSKRLATETICELVSAQPQLQRLVLAGCVQLSDSTLSTVLEHCPALSSVSLARCRLLTPAALTALHRSGVDARLQALDISGLSKITATGLLDTVLNGPRPLLRQLRLAGVRGVNDTFLARVAAQCPNLEVLDISAADPSGVMSALALRRDSAADVTIKGVEALASSPCAASLRVLKLRGRAGIAAGSSGLARVQSVDTAFAELTHSLDAQCSLCAIRMVGGTVA